MNTKKFMNPFFTFELIGIFNTNIRIGIKYVIYNLLGAGH